MKNEPILIVLAAGMGSRYGGLKQIDPVGPHGEVILDYSLYDAYRAGFRRVIFLIKHEIEKDFKRLVGDHISKVMDVSYAFQELDDLPEGFSVPEGRTKPYGTAHAVLCCRGMVDAPFAVINSDDYYGPGSYRVAYEALKGMNDGSRALLVAYLLRNTLSESGAVARGVCGADGQGNLISVCERTHIISTCDGPMYTEDGENYRKLDGNTPVSMNFWCFSSAVMDLIGTRFARFMRDGLPKDPVKSEYYLPLFVQELLDEGKISAVLRMSEDKWIGVTYRADKPAVSDALLKLTRQGLYPEQMWR